MLLLLFFLLKKFSKFIYALDVDTSDGATALCPADICERPTMISNCPADDPSFNEKSRFEVRL